MTENHGGNQVNRREFIASALACSGATAAMSGLCMSRAWGAADTHALDPVNPDLRYGITGSSWGEWSNGRMADITDIPRIIADVKRYGFQGLELYSDQARQYIGQPLVLKRLCDAAGIALVDVGDLPRPAAPPAAAAPPVAASPRAAGGGSPFGNGPFPWLGEQGHDQLVTDMVAFARDFLAPAGCDHWKSNLGGRPPGGPSDDQLKRLADTLNDIGRQTIAHGVRLGPHPHIWGPMEREHEFRRVMELTDPRYVWLTLDTGHNVLGGMDVVQIVKEYLPRIAEFHLKDTYAKYRGNKSTPPPQDYAHGNIWGTMGAYGGVDFPGIIQVIRDRKWKGWALVDVDAPRPGDGTGSIDDALAANVNYLRNTLQVRLPAPPSANS
jgi:sugar phosphate isomerase/epimerase